jgi:hypothetical protein
MCIAGKCLDWVAASGGNAVWGSSATDVWIVGGGWWASGVYFCTIDHFNGSSWSGLSFDECSLADIHGTSPTNVFAVGGPDQLRRYHGTWTKDFTPTQSCDPNAIWLATSKKMWLSCASKPELYYSDDNGLSWKQQAMWPTSEHATAIAGTSDTDVWVAGNGGSVLHFGGSGQSLSQVTNSGKAVNLQAIWGSSPSNYWAVGYTESTSGPTATIAHYDGTKWTIHPTTGLATNGSLNGVWGSSASSVFAVGNNGTILHFDGTKWSSIPSGTSKHLHDIWGASATNIWVVGGTGLHSE